MYLVTVFPPQLTQIVKEQTVPYNCCGFLPGGAFWTSARGVGTQADCGHLAKLGMS